MGRQEVLSYEELLWLLKEARGDFDAHFTEEQLLALAKKFIKHVGVFGNKI